MLYQNYMWSKDTKGTKSIDMGKSNPKEVLKSNLAEAYNTTVSEGVSSLSVADGSEPVSSPPQVSLAPCVSGWPDVKMISHIGITKSS